jgi:hypothetical protein
MKSLLGRWMNEERRGEMDGKKGAIHWVAPMQF